jgi:drug/metabolite transporter (DMT)-like permease
MRIIGIGILFAMLWASASVATKFGVLSVPPLVLANIRFFIAGIFLLAFAFINKKKTDYRLPNKQEWRHLAIFGLFNTTLYLGLYVYAMKYTAAGIGSLAVSTNPLIIVLLSSWWMGRKATVKEWVSITLGIIGIGIATYPLLKYSHTTLMGLLILGLSMITVSFASVYYAKTKWNLHNLLINGWQVTLGGIFLLPVTFLFGGFETILLDTRFYLSVLWLSIAVSVVGLICWFYLLRLDPVKASLWLFLCPVFGFIYAWWLMDEPITLFTVAGTFLVVLGLYLSIKSKR